MRKENLIMRIAFNPQIRPNINFNRITQKNLNNQTNVSFSSREEISKDDYLLISAQKERYANMSVDEVISDLRENYSKAKYPENAFSNVMVCMLDRFCEDPDTLVRFTELHTELNSRIDNNEAQIGVLTQYSEPYIGKTSSIRTPLMIEKMPLSTLLGFAEKADMSPETTMRILNLSSYDSKTCTWNEPYYIQKYNAGAQDKDSSNRIFSLAEKVIKGYFIPNAESKIEQAERIRTGEEEVYTIRRKLPCGSIDYRMSGPALGKLCEEGIKFFDTYSSFIPEEKAEEFASIRTYFEDLGKKYKGI